MNGSFLADAISISPNIPGVSNVSTSGPGGWIDSFYMFALLFSGILAFATIVYGAVKYSFSAGNPHGLGEARSWILSALIGILLLAMAWLILHTINPNLTKLQIAPLSSINTTNSNSGQ